MIGTGLILTAGLVGLCLGSYATTAGLRWGEGRQASLGRSCCDQCGAQLKAFETLPLVSFLGLRGACGRCGGRIARIHPAGEALGALIAVAPMLMLAPVPAMLCSGLGLALLAAAVVDLRTLRLPDPIVLAIALLSIGLAAQQSWLRLAEGLIAAACAFAVLGALRWGHAAARGVDGLGLGDVKLIGALALWLGAATPLVLALASALGLAAFGLRRALGGRLPFGPCIALAAWPLGVAREAGLWRLWT